MSDPLYSKPLLRLAAAAHGAQPLARADATGTARNPVCGDVVRVALLVRNDTVSACAQETKACVLTQASASILMQHMVGLSQADIAALRDQVETMLTGEGVSPSAPFGDFALFGNAMVTGARHRCVLLPFDAIAAAFDALAAREPDAERG